MAAKRRKTLAGLIMESWRFYRRQPVLNLIVLWLWIVPSLVSDFLPTFLRQHTAFETTGLMNTLIGALQVLQVAAGVWGAAAVLLLARRMIGNRAGRPRTSLRSSVGDATPLILPLFFTSLLRLSGFVYWSLLFFIPAILLLLTVPSLSATIPELSQALVTENGRLALHAIARPEFLLLTPLLLGVVIYGIRTVFYPIALVAQDERYRAALRRSKHLVRGNFWRVTGALLLFACVFLLPAFLVSILADLAFPGSALTLVPVVISYVAGAYASLFYVLALTLLYGRLRDERKERVEEVEG